MKMFKSQKGIISLFVLLSMLFLLVFVFSIYAIVLNKKGLQEYNNMELKQIYSKDSNTVEANIYASSDDIIPIYNINQFNIAGTGRYVEIDGKIYQCGRGKSYVLKQNIIVDIEEDLKSVNIGFNDYKLYLPSYYIDKSNHDIYYYYDGSYWRNIVYQKFDEKEDNKFVEDVIYENNKFSIINEYPLLDNSEFMMIWSDKKGELNNIKIQKQSNKPTSLNQINVFREFYNEINRVSGEFYIFVNIGNSI